ncbi:MAG: citrate lyase acyl carrier protein [Candidatus Izemoplasma sp.]|nr:citrate lyase acyl carrier protein [Candidatus Izemoplasma sp.]
MMAQAGTFESGDCLIKVAESEQLDIHIESVVKAQFGDQIHAVIKQVLNEHDIQHINITCHDKGALDYTIKARTLTALRRGGYLE